MYDTIVLALPKMGFSKTVKGTNFSIIISKEINVIFDFVLYHSYSLSEEGLF